MRFTILMTMDVFPIEKQMDEKMAGTDKESDNINREPIIEECTEGCTTYSKHCEYNHS